jgi:hypothetical protein
MSEFYYVVYDIRAIQNYIYRTSKVREIMGASFVVRDFLVDCLRDICREKKLSYILPEWDAKTHSYPMDNAFAFDESKVVQFGYVGGGNFVAFIQGKDNVESINKELSKRFLEKTYSLQISFAAVPKTDDYLADRSIAEAELRKVKAAMPGPNYCPGLPITANDPLIGFPFSQKARDTDGRFKRVTRESKFKLSYYENSRENGGSRFLDDITEKGEDSYLGFVHIDGNGFGNMINEFFRKARQESGSLSYEKGISKSRQVSNEIQNKFSNVIYDVFADLDIRKYRLIIDSGDDITFIVKDTDAFKVVDEFFKRIKENQLGTCHFSACAGIAFAKSHFPFDKAYAIAEECCESAKSMVKDPNRLDSKTIECALDYYICSGGNADSVDEKKEMFRSLYEKPYYVGRGTKEPKDFERLCEKINLLQGKVEDIKIARSAAKDIRSAYEKDKDSTSHSETMLEFEMIQSRLKGQLGEPFEEVTLSDGKTKVSRATYYDAACLLDLSAEEDDADESQE